MCDIISRGLLSYEVNRDPADLDYLVYEVYKLYRILKSVESCTDGVLEKISVSLALLEELQDLEFPSNLQSFSSAPPVVLTNGRGRRRFDIRMDQLEYLLSIGFTCPKIASMLGVSLRTIRR